MDHGEMDTTSKVIALGNAKATNVYLYIYHDISKNSPYSFPKMIRFILTITSTTESDPKPNDKSG